MRQIVFTLVLGALSLSGTLKAQEKMKTVFNNADEKEIRSHNANPWGWYMPAPSRKMRPAR